MMSLHHVSFFEVRNHHKRLFYFGVGTICTLKTWLGVPAMSLRHFRSPPKSIRTQCRPPHNKTLTLLMLPRAQQQE